MGTSCCRTHAIKIAGDGMRIHFSIMADLPSEMPRRFDGAVCFDVTYWNDSRDSKSVAISNAG
jgi:hypothetical protein